MLKLVNRINFDNNSANTNKDQHLSFELGSNNNIDFDIDKPTLISKTIIINKKAEL